MRLTAYKKAMDEAKELPDSIPEFAAYFNVSYSPRAEAMWKVLTTARLDTEGLFSGEFVELYKYYDKETKS